MSAGLRAIWRGIQAYESGVRRCVECGKEFVSKRGQVTCGKVCTMTAQNRRMKEAVEERWG